MQSTFGKSNLQASKTAAIPSIVTIFFLWSAIPCSIAAGIPEDPNYASQDGEQQPPIVADIINDKENELNVSKGHAYHFTQEEIYRQKSNRHHTLEW